MIRFIAIARACLLMAMLWALPHAAVAAPQEGDITQQAQFWVDESGSLSVDQVSKGAASWQPMEKPRTFNLGTGVLWMRFDLPALDAANRWYLMMTGAAYFNRASLFTRGKDGIWREQQAGDHIPVQNWAQPNYAPLFEAPAGAPSQVLLRVENRPAPTSAFVHLLTEERLQLNRQWTYLLIGSYLGFGLLVFIVGLIHARLYGDIAFDVYCIYVACMLLFQLAYTGVGGLFIWPHWAWLNDIAPATFMLLMVASGIWFVREATALPRHSRRIDRFTIGFCMFGAVLPIFYFGWSGPVTSGLLNLYALLAVVLSIFLCLWTWRRGERYSLWLFMGFLPVHLLYPYPALRAAGVVADSWLAQYAVLIGSALEIPLLLYVMHQRAKDFSENRARLRALDSTDPLTGLAATPVLRLRMRDALRRARRSGHRCAVLLVDLSNHHEIVGRAGREGGDRALVVAASRLTSVVREVDTVCRVADTRFAVLSEGPQPEEARRALAQHIVARGLERVYQLPADVTLRFRVVSASAPDGAIEKSPDASVDEQRLMQRFSWALDRLVEDPKKVVHHLEPRSNEGPPADTVAA